MNTFLKYYEEISSFYKGILESNPDYIVPVERKGCKLIRFLQSNLENKISNIRYKQYFENKDIDLTGKYVVIIDDASKYTSSLYNYKQYFEALGAIVRTFSFVGQESLKTGKNEKYDKDAIVFKYLNDSTYQEYIIQQSIELSRSDYCFDIDHLAFSTNMTETRYNELIKQLSLICNIEYSNDVYTPNNITKFCCYNFSFDILKPFKGIDGVFDSSLIKVRFLYNYKTSSLFMVPLCYPSWNVSTFDDLKIRISKYSIELPYELSSSLKNEGMYMNIIFISEIFLLKSFLDKLSNFEEFKQLKFYNYDLSAYIGEKRAELIAASAMKFLHEKDVNYCSYDSGKLIINESNYPKFTSMSSVMNHLRGQYEQLLFTDSVLNVRYFLSYDELFSRYSGKANLMKWIDILCDRGVMVNRNIEINGKYCRACRSGEGDYNHIEKKTNIILPIIINLCGYKDNEKTHKIHSTLFNKILANLAYDYPSDVYDFHNLFTKPYLFGPLTYSKNLLNNEIETPIYAIDKISSYCMYDEINKEFLAINSDYFEDDLSLFTQSDNVPYTEIVFYVEFLNSINKTFGKADALNQLIICRDKDIYYRHVNFDIIMAYNELLIAKKQHISVSNKEKHLREAAKVANEAMKKLNYNQKDFFNKLKETYYSDIRYRTAYKRIFDSKVDFSESFLNFIPKLVYIVNLEQLLVNIMLFQITFDKSYLNRFIKLASKIECVEESLLDKFIQIYNSDNKISYNDLYISFEDEFNNCINVLMNDLINRITNLPKVKDTDYALSQERNTMNVAINKILRYTKDNNLSHYTLLHFDFSGYVNIDGVKSVNVIRKVQEYVPYLLMSMGEGKFVFGTVGSKTIGTVVFESVDYAIDFAKKLNEEFSKPGLNQIVFRYGCICNDTSQITFDDINLSWKNAQICSKIWITQKEKFSNFVISEHTYNNISSKQQGDFMKICSNENTYYVHTDFENSTQNIIKYDTNTDESVQIGIITVLPEEYVAMQKMMDDTHIAVFPKSKIGINKNINREFCVGTISSLDQQKHKVVLTQTIGPGNVAASTRANCLLERFPNLDVIFMVGIAGGIPRPESKEKHVRLGDIVVCTEIIPYDFVSDKSDNVELRGKNIIPSARISEALLALERDDLLGNKKWEKYINKISCDFPKLFFRPSEKTDVIYDSNNEVIPHPIDETRDGNPRIFKGKIASANRVLKNPKKRDELKEKYDIIAVEMEGSGIADTTWEAQIGYYVIRGISDYCDGKKNDIWHNYASLAAAAYTRALIEKLPY